MKKVFTLLAMTVFAISTAMANWQPSDMDATQLDAQGTKGQVQMKTLRTPEGKIILSWLRGEMNEGVFSYKLHLQVFDANGNAQFGDEGIIVSDKPTRTWTSDYALALAPNGDILLGYTDIRKDVEEQTLVESYLYRYTQLGEPVWNVDGVLFPSLKAHDNAFAIEDISPKICVSGNNIYAAVMHTEYYKEAANEDNWQPSPWFPNQQMPDSVDVNDGAWQLVLINEDGTAASEAPFQLKSKILVMEPAADGNAYLVYDNENLTLDAQLVDNSLSNVWRDPITIEQRPVSNGMFVPTPLSQVDENGGLFLSYRVLESWSGYQVLNHLTAEGEFFEEAVSCNGRIDGDSGSAAMAVKDDNAFVAWEFEDGNFFMSVNELNAQGDNMWLGDIAYGQDLDETESWGFTPVKVIPQSDGWVLLYGKSTSWNGADFMVVKLDDMGGIMWSKQICEPGFKSSGFSVTYDDKYAYIFYTQEEQYDDNWNVIPGSGGMFVMCVDIVGKTTSVNELQEKAGIVKTEIYTVDGRRVQEMESGINIVRMTDANGNVTTTKILK